MKLLGGIIEDTPDNLAEALCDWRFDPESDIATMLAVEEHYGVTFE